MTIQRISSLPNGNNLELYFSELDEGHSRGMCPMCDSNVEGYKGYIAIVRERNHALSPPYQVVWSTNYGHDTCMIKYYDATLARKRDEVDNETDNNVHYIVGTQRQMIEYIHAHPEQYVIVNHDYSRPKHERYWFGLTK